MRVVQLFGREAASAARFAELNREHLQAHLRSITIYAVFFPVVEVLTAIATSLFARRFFSSRLSRLRHSRTSG